MDGTLYLIALVFIVTSLLSSTSEAAALNDYILDYQPLRFDPSHLHKKHSRIKRAVDPYLQWSFTAYGRVFKLHLQPAKSIFADNHELVVGNEPPKTVDTSFIYEGTLSDDTSSSAFISVINGSVSGHVIVPGHTTYHIEPARNHFQNSQFHTIIYPESRMNLDPFRHKKETSETCGSKEIYKKLSNMWQPVESSKNPSKPQQYREQGPHNIYSAEFNTGQSWIRQKRDLKGNNRTCTMGLQADKLLYNHYLEKYTSDERAREEILSIFASHINALNSIYGSTVFERTDKPIVSFRGINFQLQRSKIITDCSTPGFCNDNLDVSNFLDLTAQENHDQFCLVHTFTYRDFVGGTLGLAWVATPQSPNAGVCGRFEDVRDNNNGISTRSLNTGIVTLINFKQEVPPRVSQLTFAHEVGHNFGAQHDTTDECAPYGTSQPSASNGNYIMFPSATQGNLPNNRQFSPCSTDSIAKVLETLDPDGRRQYCFLESNKPFCGNKIVEGIEQCDCGFKDDCSDKCCQGSETGNTGCKLTPSSSCSPSQGMCCNSSKCDFVGVGYKCQNETDCAESVSCIAGNATCPEATHKENLKTFCNDNSKVCINGECMGSVCQNIGWSECFLTLSEAASDTLCYVSCRKNDTSECISSFDVGKVNANPDFKSLLDNIKKNKKNSSDVGVKRPAGSPCNNYKGYCDVFSKCRNVDAEGPFKQLTDMIFNPVTLKIIRTWIEDKWWAVFLMSIGVVVFMVVFVKIFEYNTPSKDPKKKSQPPPPSRPQGAPRSHQDKRSDVYSTDLPMHNREGQNGGQGYYNYVQSQDPGHGYRGQDGRYEGYNHYAQDQDPGQGYRGPDGRNQGYDNYAFQGPATSQQFDRVSKARQH